MKTNIIYLCLILSFFCNAQNDSKDSLFKKNQQQIANLKNRINTINNLVKPNTRENDTIQKLNNSILRQIDTISYLRKEVLLLNEKLLINKYNSTPSIGSKENESYNDFKNNPYINSKLGTCNCLRIYYGSNETDENYYAYKELDSIAEICRKKPETKIRLDGHADKSGKENINLVLSQKRVESLKNYLVKIKGINENNISTNWHGSNLPSHDVTEINLQFLNRRVEVFTE